MDLLLPSSYAEEIVFKRVPRVYFAGISDQGIHFVSEVAEFAGGYSLLVFPQRFSLAPFSTLSLSLLYPVSKT